MKNKTKIIFPCKPGDNVFIGTPVCFMDKVVPGKATWVECIRCRWGNGKVESTFYITVDHEYIYSDERRITPKTRYQFAETEIFATPEAAEKAIAERKACQKGEGYHPDYKPAFPYEVTFPCEIGDEIFIGAPKDFIRKVVPGTVKEIKYHIHFNSDDTAIVSSCDIVVDHDYIYKDESGKSCFPRVMHTDTFSPLEIFSSSEEATKAIAEYVPSNDGFPKQRFF